MKISGFTIVRNAVEYGYPAAEAIRSILPLCDEMIVNYGASTDGTRELIESIGSPKIRIVEREWDMSMREGGKLLAYETNKALDECTGDWCVYIQADEVLHEQYIPAVRAAMERYRDDRSVEGLRFGYEHFYGSFDYVQDNFRLWYLQEVRVIRSGRNIRSWGDAMGFKHADGTEIASTRIKAKIYHYGWVRPPKIMETKKERFEQLYHTDEEIERQVKPETVYHHFGHLVRFTGTHPAVMAERVKSQNWDFQARIETQWPRWLRYIILFFEPLTKRVKRLAGKRTNA